MSESSPARITVRILSSLVLSAPLTHAEGGNRTAAVETSLRAMSVAAGTEIDAVDSPLTGRLVFMSVRDGRGVPPAESGLSTAEERAVSFLQVHGAAFGLGAGSSAVVTARLPRDIVGLEHVRARQTYHGTPVVGAEWMVHLRGSEVVAANGKGLADIQVDPKPRLGTAQALATVRDFARRRLGAGVVALSTPELQILNRGLLEGVRRPTHLAWFVVATAAGLREYVWVDAHRGGVVLHFSQRPSARNRTVYTAGHTSVLPGTLIGTEGSPPTGDADGIAAYDHVGDTDSYFRTEHGRDSYDDAGAEQRSSVHYCAGGCPYDNAFWNGTQMVYGEGFPLADDVVAHELTHAVTERTAGLYYYMQSGALNESFSDIFGETVDLQNGRGTDTAGVRWLIGEDLPAG